MALGLFIHGIKHLAIRFRLRETGYIALHLRIGRHRLAVLRGGVRAPHDHEALRLKVGQHLVFEGIVLSGLVGKRLGDRNNAAGKVNRVSGHHRFPHFHLVGMFGESAVHRKDIRGRSSSLGCGFCVCVGIFVLVLLQIPRFDLRVAPGMGLVELHQIIVALQAVAVFAIAENDVLTHLLKGQVLVRVLSGFLGDFLRFKYEGGIVGAQFLHQRVLRAVEDARHCSMRKHRWQNQRCGR